MLSHTQKRVLKYVEAGSFLKLKSYLRKHKDVDVNFSQGKKERTPLHVSCSRGDDLVLRLLLKHGAEVLRKDRKGDTVLHIAANRALKHGRTAYEDLVIPLRNSCPEAMQAPNSAGVTPEDLLQWMKDDQPRPSKSQQPVADPEKEWREKLFGECENDFYESFGVYEADNLPLDDEEEDFGDWADQIRNEYFEKKNAETQRLAASGSSRKRGKSSKEKEEEEQAYKALHEKLQKEHEEYLARAKRKEEETRLAKKRRYDKKCEETFKSGAGASATATARTPSAKLGYGDIPWPAPRGTVADMLEVMLTGADRTDLPTFRKLLKRQQTLWHPDRFAQRCGSRLQEADRKKILDTVTALSQELNRLAQTLRD
ncbi:unnamed protein product [Boreogadus saida]